MKRLNPRRRPTSTGSTAVRRPSCTTLCKTAVGIVSIVVLTSIGPMSAAAHGPSSAPSAPTELTYQVKAGDYLAGIATSLGVKFPDLLTLNNVTAATAIHPGDVLKVPAGGTIPATTTAAPSPAIDTAVPALVYIVQAGDHLTKIASKLGVTLANLMAANTMTATSLIVPGSQIIVPAGGSLPPTNSPPQPTAAVTPPVAAATYVVRPGDYLIDIAARHGLTLKALLAANGLIASSTIVPGRVLALPPATLPVAAPVAPPTPTAPAPTPPAGTAIDTVVAFLKAQLGKPYEFNKAGPDSYDCSGLVRAAYLQIGISLPHQSLLQSRTGEPVDWRAEDVRPGDLVFAYSTGKNYISHVGVAISSTQWISSSQTGVPVKIGSMPNDDRIQAVRRIVAGG